MISCVSASTLGTPPCSVPTTAIQASALVIIKACTQSCLGLLPVCACIVPWYSDYSGYSDPAGPWPSKATSTCVAVCASTTRPLLRHSLLVASCHDGSQGVLVSSPAVHAVHLELRGKTLVALPTLSELLCGVSLVSYSCRHPAWPLHKAGVASQAPWIVNSLPCHIRSDL